MGSAVTRQRENRRDTPTWQPGRSIKAGAAALLAVALTALLVPEIRAQESVLDEIKKRGELRVAGVNYRPLISRRPNGQYVGIDVEVLGRIAGDLGVKLTVLDSGWDTAVAGITTKKWDIVPAICITPKRLEAVDFTQSYLKLGSALVTKTGNPKRLKSVADFNRPEVVFAVPIGALSEAIARQIAPQATIKGFGQTTSADLVQEVIAGRADVVILDAPIQTTVAKGTFGDQLTFVPGVDQPLDVQPCPVGYAYYKGDRKLGEYLAGVIGRMKASGELDALFKTWLTPEQIKGTN
jgi:ABC-type amino acid transport substrate-binding protein